MTRMRAARRTPFLLAALGALLLAPGARAQVAPDERWHTFDTEHFQVHYSEGLENLARRAAARAEEARAVLAETLVPAPRGRVHLVLADNVDYANGFASPFPRNRVVVYAHPPADEPSLAYAYDWLELVVGHELAHIHHLDYASGVLRGLRGVLGRNPSLFPNALVPRWTTEGLATYLESRMTGAGRVHGTHHDMVLRTATLEDEFFPIDRLSGNPVSWPAGSGAYVYGSVFLDWLSDRHGPERAAEFVREMGSRIIPYRLDSGAREAYGVTFTRAYAEWREELRAQYAAQADSIRAAGLTEPELLTRSGRYTQWPRYSPDGTRIAYAASTGREEASTRVLMADGSVDIVAPRTSIGPLAWRPDGRGLVTGQLEANDPYRVYSDLYAVGMDGDVDRLTRAARLMEPDVARDGRIVAVRGGGEANLLVVADADGGNPRPLVAYDPDVRWSMPRWSPDGRRIAVSRWLTGGLYDVVVMDVDGATAGTPTPLTQDRALDLNPTWSPDGRYVVFSSDRSGIPNLYAYDVAGRRLMQVTNLLTGAFQPDVSPDGRFVAFAWYRADGYHIARVPFDPVAWRPAGALDPRFAAPAREPARYQVTAGGPSRPYSPWRTLRPTTWSPVYVSGGELGTGFGAATGGTDVIERHAWGVSALVYQGGEVDGVATYQYTGLGVPVIGASALQDYDVIGLGEPGDVLERERSASLVATFPFPRFRSYTWLSTGLNIRDRRYEWADDQDAEVPFRNRGADVGAVLTVGRSSARAFDYSISQEKGWLAAATVEGRRYTRVDEGDPAGYARIAGRAQGYHPLRLPGFARHVIAARAIAAADAGARGPGFTVGGTDASGVASPLGVGAGIGGTLEFPVRGYADGEQFGDRAVQASVEYRFPLALVERGFRVLPAFLDRSWGTLFADGGAAWCQEECPASLPHRDVEPLYSVGAELGVGLTLFYWAPLDLVGGVGVPLSKVTLYDTDGDPTSTSRPGPQFYLRFGRSF